jgi:hypothetical protein
MYKNLLEKIKKNNVIKTSWQQPLNEIMQLGLKMYGNIYSHPNNGSLVYKQYDTYCSDVINAVNKLVQMCQNNITPLKRNWFTLKENKNETTQTKDITNIIFDYLRQSNFDIEIKTFYKTYLSGQAMIQPFFDKRIDKLNFNCVEWKNYTPYYNSFGFLEAIAIEKSAKAFDLKKFIKENGFRKEVNQDKDKITYKDIIQKDEDDVTFNEVYFIDNDNKWSYLIASLDGEPYGFKKDAYYYNPFIYATYTRQDSELYSRGVLYDVIDDIKQLNYIAKSYFFIVNYLRPCFLVKKGTEISKASGGIKPENIIIVEEKDDISFLNLDASSITVLGNEMRELKRKINENLFVMTATNKQQTATEIESNIGIINTDLFNYLAIVQQSFLENLVFRVIEILIDNKKIDIKHSDIKNFTIQFTNPLTTVLEKNVGEIFNDLKIISNLDPTLSMIKKNELSRFICKGVIDSQYFYTDDEIAQQQIQQQEQQGRQQ